MASAKGTTLLRVFIDCMANVCELLDCYKEHGLGAWYVTGPAKGSVKRVALSLEKVWSR